MYISRKSLVSASQIPQEFIFPEPAIRLQASSDSDATPIGTVTPATSSPSSSLSARGTKSDVFVEPKPVQVTVSNFSVCCFFLFYLIDNKNIHMQLKII